MFKENIHRPWIRDRLADAYTVERAQEQIGTLEAALRRLALYRMRASTRPSKASWQLADDAILYQEVLKPLASEELRAKADALRSVLLQGGFDKRNVATAFALVREACRRELGMNHHRVQLVGGAEILKGRIAEMATGEGKTLTALLPAATAALAGISVHIVTVNDYLAERDAKEMAGVYAALGLTTGMVVQKQSPSERAAAYRSNIVYATNKDIAFDYLRDRIALRGVPSLARATIEATSRNHAPRLLQRGLNFAIIDEADSILIDEARTPLIIAGPDQSPERRAVADIALRIASKFRPQVDFILDKANRSATLTETGRRRAEEETRDLTGFWKASRARGELIQQALSAVHLFIRDIDYIVKDEKVQIVDTSTGRIMPDRQWDRGLQQLIEAKEQAQSSDKTITIAEITFQNFFRRYLWLGGISGTVSEVSREILETYGAPISRIPPNVSSRRAHLGTFLHANAEQKWQAVISSAGEKLTQGRPVLIGTRSVAASEALSQRLSYAGMPHSILNARYDQDEATVIAAAGQTPRVTVATNMAGRGTDIKISVDAADAGGLHVILTEFHESSRIDRQLFGRAGRQGDPGSSEAIVSADDELFFTHCPGASYIAKRWGYQPNHRASVGWFWISVRLMRWLSQRRSESIARNMRIQTEKSSRDREKALSYARSVD